jgi:recombination protein RecR
MMADAPSSAIEQLTAAFAKLPGIGPKSADRIAHFILGGERGVAIELADALRGVVEKVHPCSECFNLTEATKCKICSDVRRDTSTICVVETPRDLATLERAGTYRGVYHVLGGRLAPLDGDGPEKLTVDALLRRVQRGGVKEIILATNPTLEGDGTALYVSNVLAGTGVNITRIARGIPSGSSLELANAQMLSDALEGRKSF